MSKILASIADAETLALAFCLDPKEAEVHARATAARAEHAEYVEALREADKALRAACSCRVCSDVALRKLDSLLSRVGGGA